MCNTYSITEIKSAISRSISHDETAIIECSDFDSATSEVSAISDDCDSTNTEVDGKDAVDVWGTMEGGNEFRLLLVKP